MSERSERHGSTELAARRAAGDSRQRIALLCALALASDGNKKDEKKADVQPQKVTLTAAQNKALEEIEQQFQRLQEEAQKQAQILSARESGLITAFVMGKKL